jgi:hypothetical protein
MVTAAGLRPEGLHVPLRKTFAETIAQWELGDIDQVREDFQKADVALTESVGFRWWSKSRQSSQDRHLNEYRRLTVLGLKRKGEGEDLQFGEHLPADVNDHLLFPADPDELLERIGQYLVLAAAHLKPRGRY